MFKKRELRVSVAKKEPEVEDSDFEQRMILVSAAFANAIQKTGQVVVFYIAADTIRKILINRLSK